MKMQLSGALCVVLTLVCRVAPAADRAGQDWAGLDLTESNSSDSGEGRDRRQGLEEARPRVRAACLEKEPRAAELIEAALREAWLDRARGERLRNRARLSGWLPRLDGGVAMDGGNRWNARFEPGEALVEQQQQDDGFGWDVGLSWDLARTAYHGDDLQVAKELVKRAQQRRELAAEVIRLHYARRRLLQRGLPAARSSARQQLNEYTALLDAWTAGRYSHRWCGKEDR